MLYLLLSPLLISFIQGVDRPIIYSIVAVISFFFGAIAFSFYGKSSLKRKYHISVIIKPIYYFLMIAFSILYVAFIIKNGLVDRRQGSEVMAEIYSNLPLFDLLVIRLYEVIFYPLALLLICNSFHVKFILRMICAVAMMVALFFSGILESRTKMLMPVVLCIIFYPVIVSKLRNTFLLKVILSCFVVGAFFIVAYRISTSESGYDYFVSDVLVRLDGLQLIHDLQGVGFIDGVGSLDFKAMTNLVAAIPFLDQARELKAIGMTSSKQYYLSILLGLSQLDINNTMITDLIYFGGFIMLCVVMFFYGYIVSFFDCCVRSGLFLSGRMFIAVEFSIAFNLWRIEQDFFGMVIAFFRDVILFYIILCFIRIHYYQSIQK